MKKFSEKEKQNKKSEYRWICRGIPGTKSDAI